MADSATHELWVSTDARGSFRVCSGSLETVRTAMHDLEDVLGSLDPSKGSIVVMLPAVEVSSVYEKEIAPHV